MEPAEAGNYANNGKTEQCGSNHCSSFNFLAAIEQNIQRSDLPARIHITKLKKIGSDLQPLIFSGCLAGICEGWLGAPEGLISFLTSRSKNLPRGYDILCGKAREAKHNQSI